MREYAVFVFLVIPTLKDKLVTGSYLNYLNFKSSTLSNIVMDSTKSISFSLSETLLSP